MDLSKQVEYQRIGNAVQLDDTSPAMEITFSLWGDLVLTSDSGSMTLRQLSTDPLAIPVIPSKITLLMPADE